MISQSKFETASVHTVGLRQLLVILALMISCAPTGSKAQFIRFAEAPQDWHGSLQTSVSRYRSASGVELDLVAAVHVADKRYYDKLNAYFADRDLVLYELVTDGSSTDSARGMSESGLSVVGWLQVTAASLLGLRFQLDEIAYGASNFRHADLSVSELQAIMAAKQENFITLFVAMASAQLASEQQARIREDLPASSFTTMALLSALSSEDRSQAVKYLLGKELGRSGSIAIDPAMESQLTLLGVRNEAALSALRNVLEQGQARTISLFYGAAHMAGLERVITGELGFELEERLWLAAWQIP